KFKNIPVSDYSTQGIDSIEKLSINNQDATEALKIILPFIMFSMLMGGASLNFKMIKTSKTIKKQD
ncbi:JlpA-like lipoprotein, partial [Campylobacter jejuni]|nr:JlpA-like lipoprotein [Campylobacter jejuni]